MNYTLPLILLLLFQCTAEDKAPAASATPSADAELEQLVRDYYQTMSDRDWEAYADFFTERAILTTVWQGPQDSLPSININSISEFLAKTGEGPDSQPIFEETPNHIEISRRGQDLASAWVHYDASFGTEEQLMNWSGYDLFSFIRYQGEWKITALTFASEE